MQFQEIAEIMKIGKKLAKLKFPTNNGWEVHICSSISELTGLAAARAVTCSFSSKADGWRPPFLRSGRRPLAAEMAKYNSHQVTWGTTPAAVT